MALIACPECKRQVSNTLAACPHCGYKLRKPASSSNAAVLSIVAAVLVAYCSFGPKPGMPTQPAPVDLDAKARGLCMFAIKAKLHDPSSAEFEHSRSVSMTKDGNVWTVIRPVRAKNGYGATVLQRFACVMRYSGAETLDMISVTPLP